MSDGTALDQGTLRGILVLCSARSAGLRGRIPTDLRGWLTESTLRKSGLRSVEMTVSVMLDVQWNCVGSRYAPWYSDVVQCPKRKTQGMDPNRPKGLANGEHTT